MTYYKRIWYSSLEKKYIMAKKEIQRANEKKSPLGHDEPIWPLEEASGY